MNNKDEVEEIHMNRVLIIISGGIADYVADECNQVRIFDDDIPADERPPLADYEGFEDLMPQWVKDKLENVE